MAFDIFNDEICGVNNAPQEEVNLNNLTNSIQSIFDEKMNEFNNTIRAEFIEKIDTLQSKILSITEEPKKEMLTEEMEQVDNKTE